MQNLGPHEFIQSYVYPNYADYTMSHAVAWFARIILASCSTKLCRFINNKTIHDNGHQGVGKYSLMQFEGFF